MNAYRKVTIAGAFLASVVLCAWLPAQNNCEPEVVDLIAGQHLPVGTVTVTNDSEKICVTYALNEDAVDDGWLIYEIHLAINAELADIPQTRRNRWGTNPIPGRFPYAEYFYRGVEEYTLCVPLKELGVKMDDLVYIAAHAVVMKYEEKTASFIDEETAWGEGKRFNIRGNWGMYLKYTICEPDIEVVEFFGYVGYEDRETGFDFDYNDFGMDMQIREEYENGTLRNIFLRFDAVYATAGDSHWIHINRFLLGDYEYTVTRSHDPEWGPEVPAGTYSKSGEFDEVIFNTLRWPYWFNEPQGEWVEIMITMADDNEENTIDHYWNYATSRRDLLDLHDLPIFCLYDPYMENRTQGYDIHIEDWLQVQLGGPLPCPGETPYFVPSILVVPMSGWPAPVEKQPISVPYPGFCLYYSTEGEEGADWWIPAGDE